MNQRNNRDNKQFFEKYIVQATNKRKLSKGVKLIFIGIHTLYIVFN